VTGTHVGPTPLPIVDAGPESLFGVGRVYAEGEVVRGSMPTGPWLHGADGNVALGSLGVLVDNVLGYAIIAHRPPEHWSVSTEISLDLLAPLPSGGSRLRAEARTVQADATGGFAVGEVHDEEGNLVAVCRQRGRYVSSGPDPAPVSFDLPGEVPDLATLIGFRADPATSSLTVTPVLENPLHNLHGGITLSVADLAASQALRDGGPPLLTASLHVLYARPVPGGSTLELGTSVQHRGRGLGCVEVIGRIAGRACTIGRVTAQPLP
jgi:acyl-coenzyme A thioesterase PaaI-like protein